MSRNFISIVVIFVALAAGAQQGTLIPNATEELCFIEDYPPPENSEYVLPFAVGESYEVTNGNCGKLTTHRENCRIGAFVCGEDGRFAYDFGMPLETNVLAARAGEVINVSEGAATIGGEPPNVVEIRHSDNTVARYFLLAKNGVLVELGERVQQGQTIALSGNSGAEDQGVPHLHFAVYAPNSTDTIPITFRNANPLDAPLIESRTYTAFATSNEDVSGEDCGASCSADEQRRQLVRTLCAAGLLCGSRVEIED